MKLNVSNRAEWGELHLALQARHGIVKYRLDRATALGSCPEVVEPSIKRLAAIKALVAQLDGEQLRDLPGDPV